MYEIFRKLCALADNIGKEVTSAYMYNHGFMTVDGKLGDGKTFSFTLKINKEEEENGN